MSYCGFVVCTCYQEGKTTAPPHEKYVVFDEYGLSLDIPTDLWKNDKQKALDMTSDFAEWKWSACRHEDMELCYEHLTNILGMSKFRDAIERFGGKEKFPYLSEFLPTSNDGILPAEYAHNILNEIEEFEKQNIEENRILLYNISTNELIANVNAETHLIFLYSAYNKYNFGIDKDGFFILKNIKKHGKESSFVVFRSKHFIQKYLVKNDKFQFIDKNSDKTYTCDAGISSLESDNKKDNYVFMIKKVKVKIADEYKYITTPLKNLAKASKESGNPIHWC